MYLVGFSHVPRYISHGVAPLSCIPRSEDINHIDDNPTPFQVHSAWYSTAVFLTHPWDWMILCVLMVCHTQVCVEPPAYVLFLQHTSLIIERTSVRYNHKFLIASAELRKRVQTTLFDVSFIVCLYQ